ncbi:hypothetical protein [Pseudomonas sp. Irchel 3E13]|uniref:hypothetical protein n=1 Tax=Pseudomonas sp. Irchel 3E13 TaxID=2008975 RepID=UPI000BA3B72B|nr:hypothetical protein [Pseudomonas sp. Irchel 3E13]
MNISLQLQKAGLDEIAQALFFRKEALLLNGFECDDASLLTTAERDEYRWVKSQMRVAKVANVAELNEHGRLVNLLVRTTTESRAWLSTLSLLRLQSMMDAVEESC